ncbi:hypothetical protein K501DRAFT_293486 [Backusella circina FSU 941]|nr:hypothetical protein K501DRAFT_293486 [Backusella circina FSU 941]
MTIYYTITFGILVTEMVLFGIIVLPLPSRWRHAMLTFALKSPSMAKALYALKIYTINRLQRIGTEDEGEQQHHHDYSYETNLKAKKFYTQRNLYLTGFTLFLSLILERTSALVLELLKREEELKKAKTETANITKDQQRLIDMEDDFKKQVDVLNVQIKELKKEKVNFATLKKQADQQSVEYNRLADEYNALQKSMDGESEAKKHI